jgi:hypothetical protein
LPPHGSRHLQDEVEDPSGAGGIAGETARTVDGLAYVWDAPVAPASDLVAEQAKPPSLSVADGTFVRPSWWSWKTSKRSWRLPTIERPIPLTRGLLSCVRVLADD